MWHPVENRECHISLAASYWDRACCHWFMVAAFANHAAKSGLVLAWDTVD